MQMMPCDIKSPQTKRKVLWYNYKIGNVVYDLVVGGKKAQKNRFTDENVAPDE